MNFYPRSPCGERLTAFFSVLIAANFYPRSPCGERHCWQATVAWPSGYFYPRSPCGERRQAQAQKDTKALISIHALLAESDLRVLDGSKSSIISIHALLAESDHAPSHSLYLRNNFYPRSPCGERPTANTGATTSGPISIHALLAESDVEKVPADVFYQAFLSTLSLRRATYLATWK